MGLGYRVYSFGFRDGWLRLGVVGILGFCLFVVVGWGAKL